MRRSKRSETLIARLAEVSQGIERRSKRMEAELGVTGPQRLAIQLIGQTPGLTAAEAAQKMRLHPSTVTGVLQRLEGRGLLRRTPDELDRRKLLLSLTGEGLALHQRRSTTLEDTLGLAIDALDGADLDATERVLGRIAECLNPDRPKKAPGALDTRPRRGPDGDRRRPGPTDRPTSTRRRRPAPS